MKKLLITGAVLFCIQPVLAVNVGGTVGNCKVISFSDARLKDCERRNQQNYGSCNPFSFYYETDTDAIGEGCELVEYCLQDSSGVIVACVSYCETLQGCNTNSDYFEVNSDVFQPNAACGDTTRVWYDYCQNCTEACSWCTYDPDNDPWSDEGIYEERHTCWCICGDGGEDVEYRCAKGYYGTEQDCTICPIFNGSEADSVPGENTSITDCFVPANMSATDEKGIAVYNRNCHYSN